MRIIKITLSVLTIIFGAFWILAFFVVKKDAGDMSGDIAMLIILGIVPMALGIFSFIKIRQSNAEEDKHNTTNDIIRIAQRQGGKITTLDLVNEMNLSVEDSKTTLENLYTQGILRVEVSEKGGVYYELNKSL